MEVRGDQEDVDATGAHRIPQEDLDEQKRGEGGGGKRWGVEKGRQDRERCWERETGELASRRIVERRPGRRGKGSYGQGTVGGEAVRRRP